MHLPVSPLMRDLLNSHPNFDKYWSNSPSHIGTSGTVTALLCALTASNSFEELDASAPSPTHMSEQAG